MVGGLAQLVAGGRVQSRTALALEVVATKLPSGLNATDSTG
jgi:hypothetical protein